MVNESQVSLEEQLDRKYRALQIGYESLTDEERQSLQKNELMEGLLLTREEQQAFDEVMGLLDTPEDKASGQEIVDALEPAQAASRKNMSEQVRTLASAIRRNFGKLKASAQQKLSPALHKAAVWYRKHLDRLKARYIKDFPYNKSLDEQISWVEAQQATAARGSDHARRLDNMHRYLLHELDRNAVLSSDLDVQIFFNNFKYDELDEMPELLFEGEIPSYHEEDEHDLFGEKLVALEDKLYDLPGSTLDDQIKYVAKCVYTADTLRHDDAFDAERHEKVLQKIERGALDCFTLLETARQDELHQDIRALAEDVQQAGTKQSLDWVKGKLEKASTYITSRVEPRAEDKKLLADISETLLKQKTALMRDTMGGSKPNDTPGDAFEPPAKPPRMK